MKNFFLSVFFFSSALLLCQSTTAGLDLQKKGSMPGYILFAPLFSQTTYLIDKCGKQVHTWQSKYRPGQSVYLLPDGNLLRSGNDSNKIFKGGGIIEKFDWENKLLWSYSISTATECQHHDICPLPNGNVLVLVWELKTREEALMAGRNPELLKNGLWSEKIIEIKPVGKNEAKIVWEWHAWDHLVQEHNSLKQNFGTVKKNRQLIHLNFSSTNDADWLHFNSITYNADLDQVLVSNRNFSEIFILDHSTSKQEASSHSGGKRGKGGDLIYRYGNSMAYNEGSIKDQILFSQHSAAWIEKGLKDQGKIILFNNGQGRRIAENYSSVEIITTPVDEKGNYGEIEKTERTKLYSEAENESLGGMFFSANVSSAQRLPNGNTLVCSGATGHFCELNEESKIVWLYVNPVTLNAISPHGTNAITNPVFRCTFIDASYKGLKKKNLQAGLPIEPVHMNYECFSLEPSK